MRLRDRPLLSLLLILSRMWIITVVPLHILSLVVYGGSDGRYISFLVIGNDLRDTHWSPLRGVGLYDKQHHSGNGVDLSMSALTSYSMLSWVVIWSGVIQRHAAHTLPRDRPTVRNRRHTPFDSPSVWSDLLGVIQRLKATPTFGMSLGATPSPKGAYSRPLPPVHAPRKRVAGPHRLGSKSPEVGSPAICHLLAGISPRLR